MMEALTDAAKQNLEEGVPPNPEDVDFNQLNDGAKLYIDGTLVVDNDGIHIAKGEKGSITLSTGVYPVEIHYFQGPRHSIALQWYYQPPDGAYLERRRSISITMPTLELRAEEYMLGRIVPPEIIYRPSKPRIPDALRKLQQRLQDIDNAH